MRKKEKHRRAAKRQRDLVTYMVNKALKQGKCPDCGAKMENNHGYMSCPSCDQDALSVPGYMTLPA